MRPARIPARRGVVTLLLATLASAGVPSQADDSREESSEPAPPNLLLVVIDTLRADHLSAYGYGRETSPYLEELAAEGTLYENAIAAAPWTLPSHASLFTGLHPRDHGTTSQQWELEPRFETLAERLSRAGYHTGGFSNNVWLNDATGLKQGFDRFLELWREQDVREEGISHDDRTTDMGGVLTTEKILAWIDGLPKGDDRPFFVFVNYFEPHLPYRPTKPFDGHFLPEGADPGTVDRLRSFYKPREYGYILRVPWMEVSDRDLEILTALYDAEIAYSDWILHRLFEGLRSRNLLDDTVLAVTSDHGEHLGENHMLDHKFSVYDPLLRVPLVLWAPGRVPSGRRIEGQVQAHRVFGTLLDLAGLDPGEALPLPWEEPEPGYTFAELAYPQIFLDVAKDELSGWDTSRVARALTAVRDSRYKLISGSDGSVELYDLAKDPLEARDLSRSRPEVVERLRGVLRRFKDGRLPEAGPGD